MKKFIGVLALLFVFSLTAKAQADSVGTANALQWRIIDLGDAFKKPVTAINDGTVNLYVAINAADTLVLGTGNGTKTHYFTLKPGEAQPFKDVYVRYVYAKAASATCNYRVRSGDAPNKLSDSLLVYNSTPTTVSGTVTVQHKTGDTLLTRIAAPYWKSFTATDSITRVRDALQYSAADLMTNDSTAAKGKFFAFNCAASNGGRFIITDIQVSGDTLASGGYMLVFIKDSTTANHIADNAPYVMLGNQFGNRVGEVIGSLQTTGAGTGSNNAWDYQTGVNLQGGTGASSTTVYARWIWTAAYTPAWHGTYRIKIKGLQEVLPQ